MSNQTWESMEELDLALEAQKHSQAPLEDEFDSLELIVDATAAPEPVPPVQQSPVPQPEEAAHQWSFEDLVLETAVSRQPDEDLREVPAEAPAHQEDDFDEDDFDDDLFDEDDDEDDALPEPVMPQESRNPPEKEEKSLVGLVVLILVELALIGAVGAYWLSQIL